MILPIIVYGNGDLFVEYFNAIVMAFGTSDFNTLIKITVLLAGVTVLFSFIMQRDLMVLVKWFGLYYLTIYILFLPKTTVEIVDRISQKGVPVANVPLGIAVIASYTTSIGDALTQMIEMNFSMPDDLRYGKTGLVFASRMVTEGAQFEITDSEFDHNLQSFIQQCVFYDILLKRYTLNDLSGADHLWQFIAANTSPARAFIYNGVVTTCKTGANFLTKDWEGAIDSALTQYAPRAFPESKNAKAELIKYLPLSYGYLTGLSNNANDIMQQNLMANALQRGVYNFDGSVNSSAALESYSYTRAQEQKRLTNETIGDMAAHWLPLMKNAFEAIMYGCFIFIVLLALFPFGWTILKHYIFGLFWLQCWPPLYAIINLIVSYYAVMQSSAAIGSALTLKALPGLTQINQDMAGLAGYLTLSVPFLSAGLVKGMAGTLTQLSQYVNGVTQSTAGTSAQEAVTGNFGFGNTNFGNHNSFNTSANHYDTAGRFNSGSFTGTMPNGSTITMTPNGNVVMNTQGAISNVGTSINLGNAIRESAQTQAEISTAHSKQSARSYSEASASSYRQMAELTQHAGHSKGTGEGWSMSMNASTGNAINQVKQLTERFAHDHQMSYGEAARVLSSVSGDIRAGITTPLSFNASGRREADHTASTDDRKLYSEAKDYVQNSGYSKHLDTVERAVHDKSLKINDDEGARFLNNLNTSLDKSTSAKYDMMQSQQETQSYRELAQKAEEGSLSISSNMGQVFTEWLATQKGTDGRGHMGAQMAENIFVHHPEIAQQYAKDFAKQYTKNLIQHSNAHLPSAYEDIRQKGIGNNQENEVSSHYHQGEQSIQTKSAQHHLNVPLDESLKQETNNKIHQTQEAIQQNALEIEKKGEVQKNNVQHEEHHHAKRSGIIVKDFLQGIDTHDR